MSSPERGDQDNHDVTPPERNINIQVLCQTLIMICIRALGKFMLLWSTVVLLGGFVSNLPEIDFYIITGISLLQSVRAYNLLVDEKYLYISKSLLDGVKKYGHKIFNIFSKDGQLIKYLVPFILRAGLPLLVCIVLTVVSLKRVIVHWNKDGDAARATTSSDSEVKMYKGILCFYLTALLQGGLYVPWYILEYVSNYLTAEKIVKECKFDEGWDEDYVYLYKFGKNWGEESVRRYIASTKTKYLSDFTAEWNLVKFASGLLDSDSEDEFLTGARMVCTLIKHKKLRVQDLIRSSTSRVEKLLMMLAWKQKPTDRDIRLMAANIVAHLASDINIAQFPSTLGCISSLIEPSKTNYTLYKSAQRDQTDVEPLDHETLECELIKQGFCILQMLTVDKHNSIEILKDQALLTNLIAWVRSKPFIGTKGQGDHWPTILRACLDVLVKLTSLPEQNALQLLDMIKVQVPIIVPGYTNEPELQKQTIKIFANVFYLDKDESEDTDKKRKKFLGVILDLFLCCTTDRRLFGNGPLVDLTVITSAGEELSKLSANETNRNSLCISSSTEITKKLDTIISSEDNFSIDQKSLAAEIYSQVYKTQIYGKETHPKEKRLNKLVQLLKPDGPDADMNFDEVEYFYRQQAALVYTIGIHTDAEQANVQLEPISFTNDLKRLIEIKRHVATTGRLELVKRTACLVRSMIKVRLLDDSTSSKIIDSLDSAKSELSGVDSWEIFDSNQRRRHKWLSTLESLIDDMRKLPNRAKNTDDEGDEETTDWEEEMEEKS